MAGRRQHFIPQFLQSGFSEPGRKGRVQVWVFPRSGGRYKTNITNVGVQGKFYTDSDDHDADDAITRVEGDYAELVAALRSGSQSSLDDPLIPQMLTHFEIRTRQFRQNLSSLFQRGIEGMMDHLQGASGTSRLIAYMRANPSLLEEAIQKHNLPSEYATVLEPLVHAYIRHTESERDEGLRLARPQVATEIPKIAKRSHITSLRKSTSPPKRSARLSGLRYSVTRTENGRFILGDSVVLFRMDGPKQYRNVFQGSDGLLSVYLPLSASAVLIGTEEEQVALPPGFNREVARCSLEYFIASEDAEENGRLQADIGQSSDFMSDDELANTIGRALPLEGDPTAP